MKKWMIPLLFVLAVLLLVALAFLPAIAGALQDAGAEKTVSHRPLHSIAPYIGENGSGLRFEDKFEILQECEVSSIVPALATMTEEQVRTAVETGIQPYVEAGILHPFEAGELQAVPCVAISWKDAQRWFIFWSVFLVETHGEIQYSLSVRIDDETGAFLGIEYYDPYALEDWQLWDKSCPPLNQFAQIWLEQAGLWDRVRPVDSDSDAQPMEAPYPGLFTTAYLLHDGVESPMCIYFSLSGYGEYTMRIKSMPQ